MSVYILTAAGMGEYAGNDASTSDQTSTLHKHWGGICWDIANSANQNVYTPTQIVYPSNGYWQGIAQTYSERVQTGIDNGVFLIQQMLPSDNFVLMGHNQGAEVVSGILQQLQSGTITSNYNQLLAGITLGNPLRELGHTFVGDPTGATGQGIGLNLLSGTPNLWFDITNAYDLLGNIPANIAAELNTMWQTVTGLNPISVKQIAQGFLAAATNNVDAFGSLIGNFVGNLNLVQWLTKAVALLTISGPASFLSTAATTALTFRQIATDYLDSFTL